MEKEKPKISNVEWGLVIGALGTVDLVQIVLEWLLIGFMVNPFIDIFVGMSFAFYLQMRGQSLTNPKRLFGLLATFLGEMIPIADELPLWCLDGVLNMVIAKGEEKLKQLPGGQALAKTIGVGDSKPQQNNPSPTNNSKNTNQGTQNSPQTRDANGMRKIESYQAPTGKNVLRDKKDYAQQKPPENPGVPEPKRDINSLKTIESYQAPTGKRVLRDKKDYNLENNNIEKAA